MMKWKGCAAYFKVLHQHLLERTKESNEDLSEQPISKPRIQPGPPECEAGVLTSRDSEAEQSKVHIMKN